MAKNQHSYAKRQRDLDKKRKADQKRERRAKKKQQPDTFVDPERSQTGLSSGEHSVLNIYRKYRIIQGEMLCFTSPDLKSLKTALVQLTAKGLLAADKFPGCYSLTESGFAVMKDGNLQHADVDKAVSDAKPVEF